MDGLKESKQAVGAEVLASVQNFAPPTILAQASRLNFSTRLFNLIVTNVPGPQFPLYVRGREMLDVFPVAFLPKNHALAIAIMSYNGRMNFGLLGDYDALPDIGDDRRGHRGRRCAELLRALAARRSADGTPAREPATTALAPATRIRASACVGRRSRLPAWSTATCRSGSGRPGAARDAGARVRVVASRRLAARRRSSATARSARCPRRARPAAPGRCPLQRSGDRALAVRAAARVTPRGRRAAVERARAASSAAPASRMPQPRSGVQPRPRAGARSP